MDEYIWILCDNDFGWIQDGTREMEGGEAARFQDRQRSDLTDRLASRRLAPWHLVSGSVEERVETVRAILGAA
jgi:hypothetical protein